MSEIYVMILGLECPKMEPEKFDSNKFKEFIQQVCGSFELEMEINLEDQTVIITFDDLEKADNLIETFLEAAAEKNLECTDDISYCPHVALVGGDRGKNIYVIMAQKIFDVILSENRVSSAERQGLFSLIMITKDVFDKLSPKSQDLYGPAEQLSDIKTLVHRHYAIDALQCFVISPIGKDGSEIRKRADLVFDRYIKHACDGTAYRPIRGDFLIGQQIMPEVKDALQTAPMVVAYLGGMEPSWNPNVMLEVGIRLDTGLPIVFLADSNPEDEKILQLPFDLKDYRHIFLSLPEVDDDSMRATITTIRRMLNEEWIGSCQLPIPAATIVMHIAKPGSVPKPSRFIEATPELEELFGIDNLPGTKLQPVIKHLINKMPESQRQPFLDEQNDLIARLIAPNMFSKDSMRRVIAERPIVFENHKKFHGRAFLPIIHSFAVYGEMLKLRLIYLDVTEVTQKTPEGYFKCKLSGTKQLEL